MRSPNVGSTMPVVFHLSLPTPANTMGPSLAVWRGLGPQGSLGLWLKSGDGEEGGRRLGEEEEEEEKKAGPGVKRQRESRKGKRVVFFPGTSMFQGIPTVSQAVFCFGNVTKA